MFFGKTVSVQLAGDAAVIKLLVESIESDARGRVKSVHHACLRLVGCLLREH